MSLSLFKNCLLNQGLISITKLILKLISNSTDLGVDQSLVHPRFTSSPDFSHSIAWTVVIRVLAHLVVVRVAVVVVDALADQFALDPFGSLLP